MVNQRKALRNLARNVRRLRSDRGWTKAELARQAEVLPMQITRIESSKHNPEFWLPLQIADALQVSVDALFASPAR